jgi:ADP-ribose pyrophosphatase YjhB (NUDIX family)
VTAHDHAPWQHRPSLNPALEDVRFCPRCAAPATVDFPRSLTCESCGYAVYYNPKPVAAAIVTDPNDRVILMRRATEPSRGRWTLPGGFVDLGESVQQAARRETMEEIGVDATVQSLVGVYSTPDSRTLTIIYTATTEGTPRVTEEALEVQAFDPPDIPWQELAFWSDAEALRDFLAARPC